MVRGGVRPGLWIRKCAGSSDNEDVRLVGQIPAELLRARRTLMALGVELVQGYYLGRPAPPWPQVNSVAGHVEGPVARAPGLVDGGARLGPPPWVTLPARA